MKCLLGTKLAEQGCQLCVEQVRLIAMGRFLGDEAIIRDCNVVPGCRLLLMRNSAVHPEQEVDVEAEAAASVDVVREFEVPEANASEEDQVRPPQTDITECWVCSKSIGLTGIQCRCGYYFCSHHRYAESHDCTFDHQGFHRELLEKQILGCVGDKVDKL